MKQTRQLDQAQKARLCPSVDALPVKRRLSPHPNQISRAPPVARLHRLTALTRVNQGRLVGFMLESRKGTAGGVSSRSALHPVKLLGTNLRRGIINAPSVQTNLNPNTIGHAMRRAFIYH